MSWDIFPKSKIQYFLQKLKDKFVQKETGKGLSTNDFDNTYKSKVDKIDVSLSSISGNPISISGLKANQLAVNPIITLEPIQAGSGTPSPSNIRAISGYDKIEVLSCNNLFKQSDFSDATSNVKYKTFTVPNGTYTMSTNAPLDGTLANIFFIAGEATSGADTPTNGVSASTPRAITVTDGKYTVGYRKPSYITAYEWQIYDNNKTTSISESLGQTVYGGSLDVRTGKLVNILKKVTFNGSETEGWQTFNGVSNTMRIAVSDSRVGSNVCKSNMYYWHSVSEDYDMCFNLSTTWIYVRDTQHASSVDAWKTFLQSNPLEIYYEMVTYGEIQLTPHEIDLLEDYAYVSTNGTNISLNYHNGELASLADVAQLSETVERLTEYIKGLINNA